MSKLSTFADRHMKQYNGQSMVPASLVRTLIEEVDAVIDEITGGGSES